ncbi:hypothetical protein OHS58_03735 [Amycolatopsis sp. NBC_00348]|uniref:nSTAND1 domain-containing NTPase n=1 Tax=Amycolatopsis sp. NBC_00348 TaxID=2975956 RepID=UPI002E27267A
MPRAEKPLEPGDSALTGFAGDLRTLREKAGSPPYRELARRALFSSTTLSDAAGGRRLPSLAVTLAYVRACDGDPDVWERRWRTTAAELNTPAAADGTAAPYRGLAAYSPEHAGFFSGRDRLLDTLTARVAADRLVVVVGPSGAGKTSLLRAGLAARLSGPIVSFTPGAHPLRTCAQHLADVGGCAAGTDPLAGVDDLRRRIQQLLGAEPAGTELLIVVDQFEELFTLCSDDERAQFVTTLLTATAMADSRLRLVLAVRADFEHRCAAVPGLADVLAHARLHVDPMTADELRLAITTPATRARCMIETPLLTTVVALAHVHPGALPWLSLALRLTWRRRSGTTLTLAGFQAIGEFGGLMASAAEDVFSTLSRPEQAVARDLFRRLVDPGDRPLFRTFDTGELDGAPVTADVIERFVQARVLVHDAHGVRLAHDTLLDAWPRLTTWLDEDPADLRAHRELSQAVSVWRRHDQDPCLLLRGGYLTAIRAWARHPRLLTIHEQAYLDASISAEAICENRPASGRRRDRLLATFAALLVLAFLAGIDLYPGACSSTSGDLAAVDFPFAFRTTRHQ